MPHDQDAAPARTPSRKASAPAFTPKTVESVIGREAEQIQGGHKRVAVALDRSPTWVSRMKDPAHLDPRRAGEAVALVGELAGLLSLGGAGGEREQQDEQGVAHGCLRGEVCIIAQLELGAKRGER